MIDDKKVLELDRLDQQISQLYKDLAENLREHVKTRVMIIVTPELSLSFGKHDGAWQFITIREPEKLCPVISEPRHVRAMLLSEGHVQRLVERVNFTLDAQIEDRKMAIAAGAALMGRLSS